MTTPVIVAITVAALVFVMFGYLFIGMAAKLVWGWWPTMFSLIGSGLALWQLGLEWAWIGAMLLMVAVLGPWLWQRTSIYLQVDDAIDRFFMLGD